MFVIKKEEVIKTTWRIPKPLIKQMKQAALDNDTTVSQVVIQAFKEFLDKKEKYKWLLGRFRVPIVMSRSVYTFQKMWQEQTLVNVKI